MWDIIGSISFLNLGPERVSVFASKTVSFASCIKSEMGRKDVPLKVLKVSSCVLFFFFFFPGSHKETLLDSNPVRKEGLSISIIFPLHFIFFFFHFFHFHSGSMCMGIIEH